MSRKPVGLLLLATLALPALLATGTAAFADQWTAANLRRAQMNTRLLNQNARREADGMAGKVEAARTTAPRGDGRRTRTEHEALTRQANGLNHQMMR